MSNNNPTPTATELSNNPSPIEHEGVIDPSMTDEAALEQQMEAAFAAHKQKLQNSDSQQQPLVEQPQQQSSSTQQQPKSDLAAQIEQTFAAPENTEVQEQTVQKEQPPEQDNDRVKYLQQLFKDTIGVDVSEAVNTMNNFNETAQGTIANMQDMENRISLQQQRLDLMYTWGSEAQALGLTPSELVNQRLAETTQVFSTLNEDLRNRVASQGSKGIIDLFNLIQKNRGVQPNQQQSPQTTVPQGRANIANNPKDGQNQTNLSQLISVKDDNEFWNQVGKGYQDDLGVFRR